VISEITILNKGLTNRLLGYPVDARLLIINADDFGMCNAINEAIFRTMKEGVVHSTSLMVPCPWALHASVSSQIIPKFLSAFTSPSSVILSITVGAR